MPKVAPSDVKYKNVNSLRLETQSLKMRMLKETPFLAIEIFSEDKNVYVGSGNKCSHE